MLRDSIISTATAPGIVQDNLRSNSMASFLSNETNPFTTSPSPVLSNFDSTFAVTQQMQSPPRQTSFQGVGLSDRSPSNGSSFLQSIPEMQQQQKGISIVIREKANLNEPNVLIVSGQILISYHGDDVLPLTNVPIQLQHTNGIEQITPNPQFITVQGDKYFLNTSPFSNNDQQEHVLCFTYTLKTSSSALPVRISPSWKCVENISYLMIKHNKNNVVDGSKLKGVVQVVITDQHVNNVQSTPQGVWDVAKQCLTWNMNDLLDQYEQSGYEDNSRQQQQQQRLLAKFYLEGKGTPQPIFLNYQIKDSLISGISISSDLLEIRQLETMVQSDHIMFM